MISKFRELPSGKKYSRDLLKAFLMDASKKNTKIGMTYFFTVGILRILLEGL